LHFPESTVDRRSLVVRTLAVVIIVLLGAALLVPLPLFVISPGSAIQVDERVTLARPGNGNDVSGDLLLLTVSVSQPTALEALAGWLDENRDVIPRDNVVPAGSNQNEYLQAQRRLFQESGQVASAVGLRAAGLDVRINGRGALVAGLLPGGPADGALRVGDIITAVEGDAISLASDLTPALGGRADGDEVRLTLRRGDQSTDVSVELGRVEGLDRPALGIAVETVGLDVKLPFDVGVEQGRIGGPSAGLMIALTVFDKADPADLTRGRIIAGTGTIDLTGRVGPVGGVQQKVQAAKRAGATILLTPTDEAADARKAAGDDLTVMPVRTIEEAITKLGGQAKTPAGAPS